MIHIHILSICLIESVQGCPVCHHIAVCVQESMIGRAGIGIGISSPYFHTTRYHDGVTSWVFHIGTTIRHCRTSGHIIYIPVCSALHGSQLHHHPHSRVSILISPGCIQHLLQLLPTSCIGRRFSRSSTASVLSYVVVSSCHSIRCLYSWCNILCSVIFIGTDINRTILYTFRVTCVHIWNSHACYFFCPHIDTRRTILWKIGYIQ